MSKFSTAPQLLFVVSTPVHIRPRHSLAVDKSISERGAVQRSISEYQTCKRKTPSASSLDDSKRRARSKYDNIPDLNEQYIAELGWAERKYGPKVLRGKDVVREAQQSIVVDPTRPLGGNLDGVANADPSLESDRLQVAADLKSYNKIRQRLIGDTLFVGALGLCATWTVGQLRDFVSFAVGIGGAIVYIWLLSRSVDRMAESARQTGRGGGDPLQVARIALFALLVVGTARNSDRFSVVEVILGFLTYKIATLLPLLTGEAFE